MITIDVVSDVVCPWCFVGKRRLDKALALLEGIETEVRWRPFLLDPTVPKSGMPRQEYLERKFGSAERIAQLHEPLRQAGEAEGIAFDFDRITLRPNSLDAHRLIRWAHAAGRQHAVAERLFALTWLEGEDIGNHAVLLKAGVAEGLDGTLLAQLLPSQADLDPVIDEINEAGRIGITGVPTFIIDNRFALVGAQPPEAIRDAILRAAS